MPRCQQQCVCSKESTKDERKESSRKGSAEVLRSNSYTMNFAGLVAEEVAETKVSDKGFALHGFDMFALSPSLWLINLKCLFVVSCLAWPSISMVIESVFLFAKLARTLYSCVFDVHRRQLIKAELINWFPHRARVRKKKLTSSMFVRKSWTRHSFCSTGPAWSVLASSSFAPYDDLWMEKEEKRWEKLRTEKQEYTLQIKNNRIEADQRENLENFNNFNPIKTYSVLSGFAIVSES